MVRRSYLTSTKTTHKHRKGEIIGPCGPCSFINLVGLKGSFEFEKKLSSLGRIKPFFMSDYTSFLIWGNKYNKDFIVYTASKKINDGAFNLMAKYEGVEENKLKEFKEKARKRRENINEKFKDKIKILREPFLKLENFLKQNYRVAVFISAFYFDKKDPAPHWIVAYKKEGNKYYFLDSANGNIILTKKQLKESLDVNRKNGFLPQLVAYRE